MYIINGKKTGLETICFEAHSEKRKPMELVKIKNQWLPRVGERSRWAGGAHGIAEQWAPLYDAVIMHMCYSRLPLALTVYTVKSEPNVNCGHWRIRTYHCSFIILTNYLSDGGMLMGAEYKRDIWGISMPLKFGVWWSCFENKVY